MFLKTTNKTNITIIYIYVKRCLRYLGHLRHRYYFFIQNIDIKTFESSLLYFNGPLIKQNVFNIQGSSVINIL